MEITEEILNNSLNRLAKNIWEMPLKKHGYKLHFSFSPMGGVDVSAGYNKKGEGGITIANINSKSQFFALMHALN